MLNRLPKWVMGIIAITLFNATVNWVLAPLLDVLPAYIPFGAVFLALLTLLWRHVDSGKRSISVAVVVALLAGCATLILYGATLHARDDDTSFAWILAGVACLGGFFLMGWFITRGDEEEATTASE